MGNKVTIETRIQLLENNILNHVGLQVGKDIDILDIKIDENNHIHTYCCGAENKQVMVLLHGYGGTGILYFKMMKELAKKYKVYCIDLLGMGLSSRPKFECKNPEEAINFFIDSLERWRVAIGLENFILAGHSFGGHMACHYAAKYPEIVSKLILISPLGFTRYKGEQSKTKKTKNSFIRRQLLKLKDKFFEEQITLSHIANKMWYLKLLMKKFIKTRLKVEDDIGDWIYEFLMETYKMQESSEKALFLIMNSDFEAHCPLEELVENMELPIVVFFGYRDWMDDKGAQRILSSLKKNYDVYYIKDAGHQITMENPKGLLEYIIQEEEEIVEFV
jgi:pimeloyl-ACP methyl ester carboxylesterase